ncbi:hypothetical protein MKL32_00355 [Acinetobacter sp. AOR34_HL]|uniref:hypothetical protein n=1 Tax=Acinetobacter sp. AOR34_HL TaxID=2919384 RepID=UPI0022EB2108|nr:hypothetical protein [Acinetobacter sp. AOR34_HL]MDA3500085.1 hypothetical protein [Acinetobacter sp. AOR34_HL]
MSKVALQFYWRHFAIKEAIVAVAKAVMSGYNTKDTLLSALPQFSLHRIALAIDLLITADMLENNLGVLTIHTDMNIIFELLNNKFELPLTMDDIQAPGIRRLLLNKLGCKNPAGVEMLLNIKYVEA